MSKKLGVKTPSGLNSFNRLKNKLLLSNNLALLAKELCKANSIMKDLLNLTFH